MQPLLRTMDLVSWLYHRVSQYVQEPVFAEPKVRQLKWSIESIVLSLLALAALGVGLTLCLLM